MKMFGLDVIVSEDVPKDEIRIVQPDGVRMVVTDRGVTFHQRYRVLGKIVNVGEEKA